MERRTNDMSKYKVTLTPLGKYFFGGDMTFRVEGKNDYNEQFGSYIIHSSRFPQQTSLLGMLRYLILSNSDAFDADARKIISAEKAGELIGSTGFQVTDDYSENDFRLIKRLSPCFLEETDEDGSRCLLRAPKDFGLEVGFDDSCCYLNGRYVSVPRIAGYNPKEWREPVYLSEKENRADSEIFVEDSRIGITKNYSGVTRKDDDAFYKQISYRLGKGKHEGKIHFTFYVETDDSTELSRKPYNKSVVHLGGDDSKFLLEAVACEVDFEALPVKFGASYTSFCSFTSECKVVLLSDSYLLSSEANDTVFSITGIQPFRFIRTNVDAKDYSVFSRETKRSEKYYLYEKGSVFYCSKEQAEHLVKALDKPCFRQIGYNYCQLFTL